MLAVAECCNGVASASSPPQAASPKALCSSARHQMPPRLLREEDTPRAVIAASAAEDACTATRAACLPDISGGGWAHRAAAPVSVPGPSCSRPLPPVQDTRKVRLRSLSTTSRFQPLQCFAKGRTRNRVHGPWLPPPHFYVDLRRAADAARLAGRVGSSVYFDEAAPDSS